MCNNNNNKTYYSPHFKSKRWIGEKKTWVSKLQRVAGISIVKWHNEIKIAHSKRTNSLYFLLWNINFLDKLKRIKLYSFVCCYSILLGAFRLFSSLCVHVCVCFIISSSNSLYRWQLACVSYDLSHTASYNVWWWAAAVALISKPLWLHHTMLCTTRMTF